MAGSLILLLRLLAQLYSVYSLRLSRIERILDDVKVFVLKDRTAPFSFFNWIFINPLYYNEQELDEILTHEKTHINQRHSWDVLTGEMLCALFWFNPAVWLIRFEIRQNLEFLADRNVLVAGTTARIINIIYFAYHINRLQHKL